MSDDQRLLTAFGPLTSPARTRESERPPLRLGLVQERWHADPEEHREALATGIRMAAGEGARIVCLQELTLSAYFAITPDGPAAAGAVPEDLETGPTVSLAAEQAIANGIYVHASLYERADGPDGLGFNTAIVVAPDGRLVNRTRKLHIPVTAGYYEDRYFRQGPEGAEVLVYPTAIGSEPDHPGFDTQPLWQQVIVGNGVANGTFMVAINRIGTEGPLTFYGSSFISDPYGRILVQGPRDQPAVLVADLDLDQRRDWLELFPFLTTRRPDAYEILTRSS
jgi:N-carbamoylputrescine amidase